MEIEPIRIPSNIIREIPPPITRPVPRPVVDGLERPVVDVPGYEFDYPTIDVPTEQDFQEQLQQPPPPVPDVDIPTRDLPDNVQVDVPGVGPVDLPPIAPLVTAGATAAVTAVVALGSTVLLNQLKDKFLGPVIDRLSKRSKKKKRKTKKPVLHFMQSENGVSVMEYSAKGTRLVTVTDNIEQYLRDQIDIDSLYEYDNKLIIDSGIKELLTKEGQKRFKKHLVPPSAIVKKLSAKFSL